MSTGVSTGAAGIELGAARSGDEQVASSKGSVAAQIEAQINPPVVTPPLPWAETNA